IYTFENYVFRCAWHARFKCSKCEKYHHYDWLYWCPTNKELVCGNCNQPTLKPVAFWDKTYAYEYNCEDCGEFHFGLPYTEFKGIHPWQLENRNIVSNVESQAPWEPLWSPKNQQEGKEIELAEALKLPTRIMELREELKRFGVPHGVLRYSIPESEIDVSESYECWEKNAKDWIDSSKIEGTGDPNRRYVIDPALWSLIGDVSGLSVLDAGCGNGYLSRQLATNGAKVVGLDYSRPFIEYCEKIEADLKQGCKFYEGSITDMVEIDSNSFDLVVSNVVMIDVLDYKTAFKEIARVMKDDGRFIWSNVHPVFGRSATAGDFRFPRDSRRNESRYLKFVDRYFDTGGELVKWWTNPTWQFIRTLEEYSKALKQAGFVISEIIEPRPSIEDIQQLPDFLSFDADRWTHFIIFECLKR
ncbi:MAG: methyltransferase domain-containing protein, partial [Candidatus Thorarchaeota archaeon]